MALNGEAKLLFPAAEAKFSMKPGGRVLHKGAPFNFKSRAAKPSPGQLI